MCCLVLGNEGRLFGSLVYWLQRVISIILHILGVSDMEPTVK